jgi:molybdate transport system substrate-binding protein
VDRRSPRALLAAATLCCCAAQAGATEARVAAASNFTGAIEALTARFEAETGHRVTLIFGSTGKHYAQIMNGAPFDAFFAADVRRPELLEAGGVAVPGSRFTYAVGKLMLWSPDAAYVDRDGRILERGDFRHLAIANPVLAPYGRAARQVLQRRGLWESLTGRIVRGENIAQTFQFVASGNAELGFVAASQLWRPGRAPDGSVWDVPEALYDPIEQQAVLLTDNEAARAFLSFARSDAALEIIRRFGYNTPDAH